MAEAQPRTNARAVALTALCRIETQGAYINLALAELFAGSALSPRDRAFATELAYGTLRWRGRIDWVLSHFVKRPLRSQHPIVRNVLRLSAYQLLFLPNIPPSAVGNEAVALVKANPAVVHAAPFVNAVVRRLAAEAARLPEPDADDPAEALAVRTSHPVWLVRRLLEQYDAGLVQAFLAANNEPAPVAARVNRLKADRDQVIRMLAAEGVEAVPSPLLGTALRIQGAPGLNDLASFRRGFFTAQDEASQLVAYVVAPQPGEVVWDVCSAPGTKTTHLAELMGDKGRIVACDVHEGRLRLVREGCRRLGIRSVTTVHADARGFLGEPGSADRVLIDAPCSGTGVLRRRPDLRWHRRAEDLAGLIRLQREILLGASTLVRPGGVLVYSTCSVDYEENQRNIAWFLAQRPEFVLTPLTPVLPEPWLSRLDPERRRQAEEGQLQLWPHLDGTDGFFIARLVRRGNEQT